MTPARPQPSGRMSLPGASAPFGPLSLGHALGSATPCPRPLAHSRRDQHCLELGARREKEKVGRVRSPRNGVPPEGLSAAVWSPPPQPPRCEGAGAGGGGRGPCKRPARHLLLSPAAGTHAPERASSCPLSDFFPPLTARGIDRDARYLRGRRPWERAWGRRDKIFPRPPELRRSRP